MDYPSCPKERDLNFSLKEASAWCSYYCVWKTVQRVDDSVREEIWPDECTGRTASLASGCSLAGCAVTDWVKYKFLSVLYKSLRYLYTSHKSAFRLRLASGSSTRSGVWHSLKHLRWFHNVQVFCNRMEWSIVSNALDKSRYTAIDCCEMNINGCARYFHTTPNWSQINELNQHNNNAF